jgi:hypothetical protein
LLCQRNDYHWMIGSLAKMMRMVLSPSLKLLTK